MGSFPPTGAGGLGGHISPEDWRGNQMADKAANKAMKLHPKPGDRAKLVEHIDSVTQGILTLAAAIYAQVQSERQEAGVVPQGRRRHWRRDGPEDPPAGPPRARRPRHRARQEVESARDQPGGHG